MSDDSKNEVSELKVFVGGIPYTSTQDELKKHFEAVGEVVSVEIPQNENGNSKGFALIEFSSAEAAESAIEKFNQSTFGERKIIVRADGNRGPRRDNPRRGGRGGRGGRGRGSRGGGGGGGRGGNRSFAAPARSRSPQAKRPGYQVYVNNFPWSTSWQDLKDLFSTYGEVAHASVVRDQQGRSRGFGSVRFVKEEDALAAINGLNNTDYNGRVLTVRKDRYQE